MVVVFVAPSVVLVALVVVPEPPHPIPVLLSAVGVTKLFSPPFMQAITPPSAGSPIAAVVFKVKLCVPLPEVHSPPLHVTGTHAKLIPVKLACGVLLFVLFNVTAIDCICVISATAGDTFEFPTFHADAATIPNGVVVFIVNDVPSGVVYVGTVVPFVAVQLADVK